MGTLTYWGSFKSKGFPNAEDNGNYSVEFSKTVEGSNESHEIILGPNPISINWNTGGETIYSPIKCSKATVQIVSNDYLERLFSTSAKGTRVRLRYQNDNNQYTLWTGYTQPNLFSAPYDHETETFEFECYDGLSILEYFDYEIVDSNSKSFVNFARLIDNILSKSDSYRFWYFTQSIYLSEDVGSSVSNRNPLSKMTITESNFFDENGEPMKMKEILEEVCKYLGVTVVAYNDSVYFINYDDINRGNNSANFYKYTIGNYTGPSTVNVEIRDIKTITTNSFASSGATYTILGTYNRATVRDSLYTVDSIIPSLYENEDLINVKGYPWTDVSGNIDYNKNWTDGFQNLKVNSNGWCETRRTSYNRTDALFYKKYFDSRIKLYENKKYKSYYYTSGKTQINPSAAAYTGNVQKTYNGYEGSANIIVSKLTDDYAGGLFARVDTIWADDESTYNKARYEHSSYDWQNYVLLNLKNYGLAYNQPLIESKPEWVDPFFISSNAVMIIKGSIQFDDRQGFPIPLENYEEKHDEVEMNNIHIYAKLKMGDKYYNGAGWGTSSSNWFTILFGEDLAEIVHVNGQRYDVLNTVDLSINSSDKGQLIRMPNYSSSLEYAIPAKPELTIMGRGAVDNDYRLDNIWLKDFDIIAHMPRLDAKDENDTDTEYTYEADVNSISDFNAIEFKICTWDSKNVNYSAVAYSNGYSYIFVDKIHNEAITYPDNVDHRPEECLAYRIVNQYTTPTKKLQLILKNSVGEYNNDMMFAFKPWSLVNYDNRTWVVDAIENDVVNCNTSITLIEKK